MKISRVWILDSGFWILDFEDFGREMPSPTLDSGFWILDFRTCVNFRLHPDARGVTEILNSGFWILDLRI